jgi:hypothetical protein
MKLAQEMAGTQTTNVWEFAGTVASIAKEFEIIKRMKIETAAGELIGLTFPKE